MKATINLAERSNEFKCFEEVIDEIKLFFKSINSFAIVINGVTEKSPTEVYHTYAGKGFNLVGLIERMKLEIINELNSDEN
jgi:hypothetical protein